MTKAITIGINIAKNVFHLHGAAPDGAVVFQRKLSRVRLLDFLADQPPCLVAMEACAGAHHWGREIGKLGHEVRLIGPTGPKLHIWPVEGTYGERQVSVWALSMATTFSAVNLKPCRSGIRSAEIGYFGLFGWLAGDDGRAGTIHIPLQHAILSVQRLPVPARNRWRCHRSHLRRVLHGRLGVP